ncbi:hypothetical protein NEUTE1DRAFT_91411 [Neurospora tetrasperma FGSC 2508]|uniref:Homeobox domain-containing protein n=1 Tax=Neurospora tetrasperma (strain FGSC 2508 / ATCC MYA-4615 / P0657) TaxID=510951 RepID=F8N4W9_NEUT8|nr:uncharacterized protein NEUTE1DRAFT_91411 [Neurospora tetrasperma FGSC 2508]EGO52753.1 hypothetical protein NEUTE1DRAFT_91411 [Neurospora tetrasperma FGSC 2508]
MIWRLQKVCSTNACIDDKTLHRCFGMLLLGRQDSLPHFFSSFGRITNLLPLAHLRGVDELGTMDPELLKYYQQQYYPGMGFAGPQHTQHHGPQYQVWSPNSYQWTVLQQQRAAMMVGPGSLHPSKQTEPKPRLAKDEVELLEREFAKNPKPNTSLKRELAEQMGVEVPRINNWFQNRRAKEKQMRKTAEFEAQQARERAESESKPSDDQDQGTITEFYGLSNRHQPLGLSTASIGSEDGVNNDQSDRQRPNLEQSDLALAGNASAAATQSNASPSGSDSDGFAPADYNTPHSSGPRGYGLVSLATPTPVSNSYGSASSHMQYSQPAPFPYGLNEPPRPVDGLPIATTMPQHNGLLGEANQFGSYTERSMFMHPSDGPFPSQMGGQDGTGNGTAEHPTVRMSIEGAINSENMSPSSGTGSSPVIADLRLRSPPPPSDIASRRNLRRPAPLGPLSLRTDCVGNGPKTGIDVAPRRMDNARTIRRMSSATGSLTGRIQKSLALNSGGPRSPFPIDRKKEALLQGIQNVQSPPIMASLNSAMSPMTNGGSDDEQAYTFGSCGAVSGMSSLPPFKSEAGIKTPPGTPGLGVHFRDPFAYSAPADNAWGYVSSDEPLPTPGLCSNGGSELDYSMAPQQQLSGYVTSQPVTPSFAAAIGPTYNNVYGTNGGTHLARNTEYTFPESYQPESSSRCSPAGQLRAKQQQFQFAQNVTPQDFSHEK